jgi:hypothetical protein
LTNQTGIPTLNPPISVLSLRGCVKVWNLDCILNHATNSAATFPVLSEFDWVQIQSRSTFLSGGIHPFQVQIRVQSSSGCSMVVSITYLYVSASIWYVVLSLSASTAASEQFKIGWHSGKGKSTGSDHYASSVGM